MNTKTFKTLMLVVVAVIILAALATVFFLSQQATYIESTEPPPSSDSKTTSGSSFPSSINRNIETAETGSSPGSESKETETSTGLQREEGSLSGELKNISEIAVAGVTFIEKDRNGEKTTFVRYIERGTGHIKEIAFDENIATKVTNTTLTAVYDSKWNKDGSAVILRRLEGVNNEIQTIYGTIEAGLNEPGIPEGGVGRLDGKVLPPTTLDVAVSPQKDRLFYLIKSGDSVFGTLSEFKGKDPFQTKLTIWDSLFSEWQIIWPKQDEIMLLTKPAYNVPGYLYSLTVPKDNKFEKIIGDIIGLTAITSATGKKILYSETTGLGFMTYLLDRQSGEKKVFPVKTLPEKCVWSKLNENIVYCGVPKNIIASKYPDNWYKGLISFSDDIYRIDLDIGSGRKVNLSGLPEDMDATQLTLSPKEDFLSFINKKNNLLWTAKIK